MFLLSLEKYWYTSAGKTILSQVVYGTASLGKLDLYSFRQERPKLSVQKWRYYQNFLQLFNDCNANLVLPVMSVSWTCIGVTSSYAMLKLNSILPLPMVILMACMCFDAYMVINCVFKYAGEVNENSSNLIHR